MDQPASRSLPLRVLGSLFGIVTFLILELVLTMLVYTALNVYSLELFGTLVRFARSVLELMTSLVESLFPSSANTVYATLFGELGPKSILLLLIGLLVAAIIRLLVNLVGSLRQKSASGV